MPKNYFDDRTARFYDRGTSDMFRPEVLDPTVEFLFDLVGTGRALEFAIGTGRVALPLHQRGVPVAGIDLSPQMVAQLRAKPGADDIDVIIGDMTSTRVSGTFRVVYVVFNSIGNLLTQAEQVDCFRNAAAHLEPGGFFVVEKGVPNLEHLSPRRRLEVFTASQDFLGFDEVTDFVGQQAVSHHYGVSNDTAKGWSVPWRWAWPSELDLMAQLAGMTLHERWSTWTRSPFTEDSTSHISVWQLAK
ncbi:MAG: hypothetical protein QOH79_2664 [Acidimicrobiaceae bacterium]|jgi:SAM-dependent methyltransferase